MKPLRVHRIKSECRVLGPGTRAVVWFQGCALDCPGCIAAEMNRSREFRPMSPQDLADALIAMPDLEGITLSGGDPFDQPLDSLASFLEAIREQSSLGIICYTGRTLDELLQHERSEQHQRILSSIDLLIDGRYVEEQNDGSLWRGSANQRLIPLTSRYAAWCGNSPPPAPRGLEIELSVDSQLTIAGIPRPGFMDNLRMRLAMAGHVLT